MSDTPKLNVSLKLDGAAPWVTVYADTPQELDATLQQIASGPLGPRINAAIAALRKTEVTGVAAVEQVLGGQVTGSYPAPPPAWTGDAPEAAPAWAHAAPAAAPAAPAAPAYQQPAPAAAAPGAVQGPVLAGIGPAKMISGTSSRGAWSAWADPRPKAVIDMIPKGPDGKTPTTNDPNDPRLAAGQVKFMQFIR